MFNLFFNGQKICQISSFAETLECFDNETDESVIFLSLFIEEEKIPVDFDLGIFTKYSKFNSLSSIEITDEQDKKIFYTTFYDRVNRVRHFLDDANHDETPLRKVWIELERGGK